MRVHGLLVFLIVVMLILFFALIFIDNSDSPNTPPLDVAYGYGWTVVQSPVTGLCYEIARGPGHVDIMGMAEIPCSLLEELSE